MKHCLLTYHCVTLIAKYKVHVHGYDIVILTRWELYCMRELTFVTQDVAKCVSCFNFLVLCNSQSVCLNIQYTVFIRYFKQFSATVFSDKAVKPVNQQVFYSTEFTELFTVD